MPISVKSLRNFYFGTGVESYIMSQLQVLNCNTEKLMPDFGFDIHVTNLAAQSYLNARAADYYIQVKSRIYSEYKDDGIYSFSINKTDFSLIEKTQNAIVVFVIAKPRFYEDPLSFEEDRGQLLRLDQQIECSSIRHFFNESPNDARTYEGHSEVAEKVKGYDFSYIWCTLPHLRKLMKECGEETYDNFSVKLSVSKNLTFSVNSNPIVPELHDLWFLVNDHDPKLDSELYPWWAHNE